MGMDLLLIIISIIGGALSSIIISNVLYTGGNGSKSKTRLLQVTPSRMEVEELESLKIEKIILDGNMVKIHEAYKNHKLPKLEYDRLRAKYAEDIHNCKERFHQLQVSVDITELKELRKDLVSLLEAKIKNIDEKLNKVSSGLPISQSIETESALLGATTQTKFGKQIKRTAALEQAKIGKLNEEILHAVAKMDSTFEVSSSTNSKVDGQIQDSPTTERDLQSKHRERDALGNF
jgi:hypothetical protein